MDKVSKKPEPLRLKVGKRFELEKVTVDVTVTYVGSRWTILMALVATTSASLTILLIKVLQLFG